MHFKQEQGITTFHRLTDNYSHLPSRLNKLKRDRSMSLVLPLKYDSKVLEDESFNTILTSLKSKDCSFIKEIIIPLSASKEKHYQKTFDKISNLELEDRVTIAWCDGNNIQGVIDKKAHELPAMKEKGKGRDAQIGLALASDSYATCLHDLDIKNYDSLFPAKLFYPLVEPELGYSFNKGFYARIKKGREVEPDTMWGRVTRLGVWPLLDSLETVVGESEFITHMKKFNYPLAGEFAMIQPLALSMTFATHWELETISLFEACRRIHPRVICQTDLAFYDHQHKQVKNLGDMFKRIGKTMIQVLAIEGKVVGEGEISALQRAYKTTAQDYIAKYAADANFNNISYSRHGEEKIVEDFNKKLYSGWKDAVAIVKEEDKYDKLLPNIKRIVDAYPRYIKDLRSACKSDIKEYAKK
ncbi:MAG: hypothetical protein JSW73_04745 [Candidatus Woesearchaeota archaeon]|nr:MAG: hypothetical protein JSW73_04745 [Candidatus Woesearchaeota archaeon]